VQIRLHQDLLYSAIYRADDQLLVSQHAYGIPRARYRDWRLMPVPPPASSPANRRALRVGGRAGTAETSAIKPNGCGPFRAAAAVPSETKRPHRRPGRDQLSTRGGDRPPGFRRAGPAIWKVDVTRLYSSPCHRADSGEIMRKLSVSGGAERW
jgi:hypothetical protein